MGMATLAVSAADTQGDGTAANPYTVADVQQLGNPGSAAWVQGYIVGYVGGDWKQAKFEAGGRSYNSLVLGPDATASDISMCIPVSLSGNADIRNALNLSQNPGNLGKYVMVHGSLEMFLDVNGVKNLTEYSWEQPTAITEIEQAQGQSTYYNLQGQPVAQPQSGVYIRVTGNKAVKVAL